MTEFSIVAYTSDHSTENNVLFNFGGFYVYEFRIVCIIEKLKVTFPQPLKGF